ncbi:hypothetical protein RIF29_32834 [Crotalaria pallida]|uniref:Uncharacterized protein n=1 Tax=Crotalaria pallida TaxID=3830 RepID=A0AAN9EL36_CROPI
MARQTDRVVFRSIHTTEQPLLSTLSLSLTHFFSLYHLHHHFSFFLHCLHTYSFIHLSLYINKSLHSLVFDPLSS